jgi:hypothetical protein
MNSILVRRQQRRALRRAVKIDCQVVREKDFKLIGRSAVDLSPHGMLVVADERVLTGEDVIVSFRAPSASAWFDCSATVARVVHGRRPGDWGPCIGLNFDSLDDLTRIILHAHLRGVPPPLPMRAPRIDYAESVRRLALD